MSEENVELVRGLIPPPDMDIASLFRDDTLFEATIDAIAPMVDPEVESVAVWQGGTTYAGVEGFREMWLDWLHPWAAYYTQVDEIIDAGDRVVILVRDRGRRTGIDAEIELRSGSIWEVRDGKVVRVQFCGDRREALEAAGLSE